MNRSPLRPRWQPVILAGSAVAAMSLAVLAPELTRTVHATLKDSPKAVLDEAWQIVNREYVDGTFNGVNWQAVRQQLLDRHYTSRDQAYAALRAALAKLQDPYTRFMDPKQYRALNDETSGQLSGVGIELEVDKKTKILTVVQPISNSPASRAGIKAGDQILAIDGTPTYGMDVEEASKLIRGKVGTKVTLRVMNPEGHDTTVDLTRAVINVPSVNYALRQEGPYKIGYIRLSVFSANAPDEMEHAIKALLADKVNGFVLDLRDDPGGLLEASVAISRMWMNSGAIVRTVDREGDSDQINNNHTALTNLPLAVLVDGNSASSSEILTGALKDNGRAIIVGTKTFGKALVQSVHQLSDGSGLAVTIAHYYTPKGTDINHVGIEPQIKVSLDSAARQRLAADPQLIGTDADPQYARAVQALEQTALTQTPVKQSN